MSPSSSLDMLRKYFMFPFYHGGLTQTFKSFAFDRIILNICSVDVVSASLNNNNKGNYRIIQKSILKSLLMKKEHRLLRWIIAPDIYWYLLQSTNATF